MTFMIIQAILLIAGFALLIKGADVFVGSSVDIAKKLRVSSIVIGLTIVSFGTSAPEAVVSITASAKGVDTLSIGNVVGSNVFNLLVVVGVCSLIKPLSANLKDISKDFIISIGAALALMLMMFLYTDKIPRYAGAVILAVFLGYIVLLIKQAQKSQAGYAPAHPGKEEPADETEKDEKEKPLWHSILLAALGCAMIGLGGQLTVDSAVEIAGFFGITERVVGLTIVAVGTSLPELITSLVAGKKGETGIALGNVVGSNIFNIMFVLGLAGSISPLTADVNIIIDLAFVIAVSLLMMLFIRTGKKVSRIEGLALVALYAGYMAYVIIK